MKKLENLSAETKYLGDLQLGCLKGCLDHLGIEISLPWLAGTMGQAFCISIARDICLSSVWNCLADAYADGTMTRLGKNLGYNLEYHRFDKNDPDFLEKRTQAWERLREAIDAGHPCYGYYNFCYQLYCGYDDDGFYVGEGATNAGQGPFSMLEMDGIELCIVSSDGVPCDDQTAVKEGLHFALQHARAGDNGQPHDINSEHAHGVAAYNRWIAAMEVGKHSGTWRAIDHYVRYRELAVQFLEEAQGRLDAHVSPLLREARHLYRQVCDNLWPIADAFGEGKRPIPFNEPGSAHSMAADKLRAASDAEKNGLVVLRKIAESL